MLNFPHLVYSRSDYPTDPLKVERVRLTVACAVALLFLMLTILFLILFATKKCRFSDSSFPSRLLHFNKRVDIVVILSKKPIEISQKNLLQTDLSCEENF